MTHKLLISMMVLAATNAIALVNVGDAMPLLKWQDVNEKLITSDDNKGSVQVLLYNGGFCGPCNEEFSELVPQVGKYEGKPVKFISLSVASWESAGAPDTQFLKEWQQKHSIPFTVAASSRKEEKNFFSDPKIPNVVIVDAKGNLAYKAINPGVAKIFKEIDKLLSE